MPQRGFLSITVSEEVYDRFFKIYNDNIMELKLRGITSFSGFCTDILKESIKQQKTFEKYAPVIQRLQVLANKVILKDNRINRIIELDLEGKERVIKCVTCNSYKCSHVGFCCSLNEIYPFKLKEEIEQHH